MDFDATSYYPSAMWDEKPVVLRIESRFAFKLDMNDVYVRAFNIRSFNRIGKESKILKMNYYKTPKLMFQPSPVEDKIGEKQVNRMKKAYIIDYLTSVDFLETVKVRGKVIQTYDGSIFRENFKVSLFREVKEKLSALRNKYKKEDKDSMQELVKLIMNSLYGVHFGEVFSEIYKCKSEKGMQTEYDKIVSGFWKPPNGNYFVKMKKDERLDSDNDIKQVLLCHSGAFFN